MKLKAALKSSLSDLTALTVPRISVDVPLLKAVENFPIVNLMVLNLCNHCMGRKGRRLKTLLHSLVFLLLFTIMPSTDVQGVSRQCSSIRSM